MASTACILGCKTASELLKTATATFMNLLKYIIEINLSLYI